MSDFHQLLYPIGCAPKLRTLPQQQPETYLNIVWREVFLSQPRLVLGDTLSVTDASARVYTLSATAPFTAVGVVRLDDNRVCIEAADGRYFEVDS